MTFPLAPLSGQALHFQLMDLTMNCIATIEIVLVLGFFSCFLGATMLLRLRKGLIKTVCRILNNVF